MSFYSRTYIGTGFRNEYARNSGLKLKLKSHLDNPHKRAQKDFDQKTYQAFFRTPNDVDDRTFNTPG